MSGEILDLVEQQLQHLDSLLRLKSDGYNKYNDRLARLNTRMIDLPNGTSATKVLLFLPDQSIPSKLAFLEMLYFRIYEAKENFIRNINMHILATAQQLCVNCTSKLNTYDLGAFMFAGLRLIYANLHILCIEQYPRYDNNSTRRAFADLNILMKLEPHQLKEHPLDKETFTALAQYACTPILIEELEKTLDDTTAQKQSPRVV